MTWDEKFLKLAFEITQWSKDRSTKVGSVIVGPNHEIRATGYNGMPRGINDDVDARHERPAKYAWTEHSERNAIYNAARIGVSLEGSTLYIASTPSIPPCADCARAIIQSGIKRIVSSTGDTDPSTWPDRWKESMTISMELFKEAGVVYDTITLNK
jgi:dCMP deaminase